MPLWKSVEYVEVAITAASEPVTTNLTKGQDETQCTPFWSQKQENSVNDEHRQRMGEVEIVDNSGTAAVRVSASAKSGAQTTTWGVFIVEWDDSVTIQQIDVSGLNDGTASVNVTVTDVTAQANAFLVYSYQFTDPPASEDDWGDVCIQARFNGASTTSVTLSRRLSEGAVNGTLFVIESTQFVVDHREIDVTSSSAASGTDTISATVAADTMLIHSYESSESGDDARDGAWQADLQNTTTVRIRRGDASPSGQSATSTHSIAVVECKSNEFDVQREDVLLINSTSVTDTITEIDQTRTFINCLDCQGHPVNIGRHDGTTGPDNDNMQYIADFSAVTTVRYRIQAAIENGLVSYEVVQFAALVAPSGTGAITLQAATLAGVGVMHPSGTGVLTLDASVVAGVGVESIPGTGVITLDASVIAGVGVMQPSGTGVLTLLAPTLAGVGVLAIPGTGVVVLDGATLAGVGVMHPSATAALVLDAATLAGVGVEAIPGTATIVLDAATLAGVGVMLPSGTGVITLDVPVIVASGTAGQPEGTGVLVLDAATLAGVGVMLPSGTGVIVLDVVVLAGVGVGAVVVGPPDHRGLLRPPGRLLH